MIAHKLICNKSFISFKTEIRFKKETFLYFSQFQYVLWLELFKNRQKTIFFRKHGPKAVRLIHGQFRVDAQRLGRLQYPNEAKQSSALFKLWIAKSGNPHPVRSGKSDDVDSRSGWKSNRSSKYESKRIKRVYFFGKNEAILWGFIFQAYEVTVFAE